MKECLLMKVVTNTLIILLAGYAAGCRPTVTIKPDIPTVKPPVLMSSSHLPKEMTLDLGKSVKLKLKLIEAGTFMMGSDSNELDREPDEGPARKVTLTKPFYIGVYEVTQEQYKAVTGKNPSRFKGPGLPVDSIWWTDAVEFCKLASRKTGQSVHLPLALNR